MQVKDIYTQLKKKFGDKILDIVESEQVGSDAFINVEPTAIKEISMFLRDEPSMDFDYLALLSGMDYKDSLGVVYNLYSIKLKHRVTLKIKIDRIDPHVPTIERVWKAANWHEREAYDMFGIWFDEHPNMERILCPEDWDGYPLRKDYVAQTSYHGIDAMPNEA
jgi:NADH-quinone oxidoreductase subunit C